MFNYNIKKVQEFMKQISCIMKFYSLGNTKLCLIKVDTKICKCSWLNKIKGWGYVGITRPVHLSNF